MPQITGIRGGHRIITTVTRQPDGMTVTRAHHPDCPCRTQPAAPCPHCLHTGGHHVHCPHF